LIRSTKGNKIRRTVEFIPFLRRFCKVIGITSLTPKDNLYFALQYLFVAKGTKVVNLENFGKVMGHYGQGLPGKWWPLVMESMNHPYFFGSISSSEAVTLLEFSEPGEFLVRYSKSHGNWVVSWVHQRGKVLHTPVKHAYCSEIWIVTTSNANQKFSSITEVIDAHKNLWKKPVVLCPPCTGIFVKGWDQLNETSGYMPLDLLESPANSRDSVNNESPKENGTTPKSTKKTKKKESGPVEGKLISSPRSKTGFKPSKNISSPSINNSNNSPDFNK